VFLGVAFTTASGAEAPPLSLQEAHDTALRNHPQIRVADLRALAARQVSRQVQAAFYPTLAANVMSVGTADENTRLAAIGGLNNPSIFDRNAEGLVLSQLITDFGRTANLSGSAKLQAQAEAQTAQATREQILLAVDASFFAAQQAQSVTRVAQQTVATRQLFLDQVTALASNKLRSELDLSFAKVNVDDARLLLSKAQNDSQAEFARLANLMGLREPKTWHLVEEPPPPPLSTNISEMVEQGLQFRPELMSLRNSRDAALKFSRAEKALRYPIVSAVGSAGVVPVGDSQLPENYAAAGLSISLPLYTGGLYAARQREAALRAQAAEESLRNLENNVIRDVRIAWLNAQNAFDRLRITAELLDNTKLAYDLAQARYKTGISSIVEFNQAELNLLAAQLTYANTQYEYLLQRSALSFQTGSLR
jgi:outer membrane protein